MAHENHHSMDHGNHQMNHNMGHDKGHIVMGHMDGHNISMNETYFNRQDVSERTLYKIIKLSYSLQPIIGILVSFRFQVTVWEK